MNARSDTIIRGWETRRKKYGPSGKPSATRRPSDKITDAEYFERLKSLCKIEENGCWMYQGFLHKPPRNYGDMSYRSKNWRTHRLSYFLAKGPIPKGMVVMHTCDHPPCCNPDHLKLGTHLENMADCRAKGRYYYANLTHCKRGHEFNDENTFYITTPGEQFGLRQCKACRRGHHRIRHGWPDELAYVVPPAPLGFQLVRVFRYVEGSSETVPAPHHD